jgi:hypothetical protein
MSGNIKEIKDKFLKLWEFFAWVNKARWSEDNLSTPFFT